MALRALLRGVCSLVAERRGVVAARDPAGRMSSVRGLIEELVVLHIASRVRPSARVHRE